MVKPYISHQEMQRTSDSVMKRLDDPSISLAASLFNTSVLDSVGKTDVASLPNTSSLSKTRSSLQSCFNIKTLHNTYIYCMIVPKRTVDAHPSTRTSSTGALLSMDAAQPGQKHRYRLNLSTIDSLHCCFPNSRRNAHFPNHVMTHHHVMASREFLLGIFLLTMCPMIVL